MAPLEAGTLFLKHLAEAWNYKVAGSNPDNRLEALVRRGGELPPLSPTLESSKEEGQTVPVHLHSNITEVGTLELSCISRDQKKRWKLEFNVRERTE